MLTETCWCPPMVQMTAKKHRKVETGRFSSGHFLVVSPSAILLSSCNKLDSWEGKFPRNGRFQELSSVGQFRSSAVSMKRLTTQRL